MSETSTTASGETESATTEAETDGTECLGLDRAMCLENPLCMAIAGAEIMTMGEGACLGEREFIDCQPATGCAEVITYACEGDDAPLYEFPNSCIPLGWSECGPPPPIDLPSCR